VKLLAGHVGRKTGQPLESGDVACFSSLRTRVCVASLDRAAEEGLRVELARHQFQVQVDEGASSRTLAAANGSAGTRAGSG
jgi:hypothetical protein